MTSLAVADEDLLHAFLSGNETAFEALVLRHRQELFRMAICIVRSPEDAEDALQQALIKVYERASQYRGEAPVKVWLRRLLASSCLDLLRRRRVRSFLCPWGAIEPASIEMAPDGPARYGSLRTMVESILSGLPARQRAIFALRVFEEWSLPEIAQSLRLDVGTVKTHLFRAIHRVREELQGELRPCAVASRPALARSMGDTP